MSKRDEPMSLAELPAPVQDYLRLHISARRRLRLWGAVVVAVSLLFTWALLWCFVDRLVHLSAAMRWCTLLFTLAALAARLYRPLRHFMDRRTDLNLAAEDLERLRPEFGEKLETVCSRLLGPQEQRGSAEMLRALVEEVRQQVAALPPRPLVNWRVIRVRVLSLGAVAAILALLCLIPSLGLPQLAARFAAPWAEIAPVTTTQLRIVSPAGNGVGVRQGQGVAVMVEAKRVGDGGVWLHTSTDGQTWVRRPMTPAGGGLYAGRIGPVDKDQWFRVGGGDAMTAVMAVRVLKKPAITEFGLRYEYPSYTGRAPLLAQNADGLIEAPTGSKVALSITVTEPLQSATLRLGGKETALQATVEPTVYRVAIPVLRDEPYRIEMVSRGGLVGAGPDTCAIRAIPDRAPLARLVQPADDMRLRPTDVTPLYYQAMDDYGVSSLLVRLQVNGQAPSDLPLKLAGDARAQEGKLDLDLATCKLRLGDVVSVMLVARDGAGQVAMTSPRHIFISPESRDLARQLRRLELQHATNLAGRLLGDLETAAKAMDEARAQASRESEKFSVAENHYQQAVTSAGEDAAALKRQLLRAMSGSLDAKQADLLTGFVDRAQQRAAEARNLVDEVSAPSQRQEAARQLLSRGINSTRVMKEQLELLEQGEKAASVLADLRSAQAAEAAVRANATNPLVVQMLEKTKGEIREEAKSLGLNPDDGGFRAQLEQKVEQAVAVQRGATLPDLAKATREWAQRPIEADNPATLDERLSAAAQAESVRRDSDLARARDLETAARAAERIDQTLRDANTPETRAEAQRAAQQLAQALEKLQGQSRLPATPLQSVPGDAPAARAELVRLAGDATAAAQLIQRTQMQANADMAAGEYDKAAQVDAVAAAVPAVAQAKGAMAQARRIDALADRQQELRQQLEKSASAADVAQGQTDLVKQIERARADDDGQPIRNLRSEAIAMIQQAQERLAAMPQQLKELQGAGDARAQAASEFAMLEASASSATAEAKPAAERAAERARLTASDAGEAVAKAQTSVQPEVAKVLAAGLAEYSPSTDAAATTLEKKLAPSLAEVKLAVDANDTIRVAKGVEKARQMIAAAQEDLRAAQAAVLDQDPLFAAQTYAKAAAQAMREAPPDVEAARVNQEHAARSLSQAWRKAINRATDARLSMTPEMAEIYMPGAASSAAVSATADLSSLREWGRLRQKETEMNSPVWQEDTAGYRQMLQVYFEVLGKSRVEGERP